jgi:predicted XRE-type DNA-binding protein
MQATEKLLIEKSSGNIFADLGFSQEEAINLSLRSKCMREIERWYKNSGLTQAIAAKTIGITQPRFNAMLKGAIDQFSLDALVNMSALAGLRVHMTVTAPKTTHSALTASSLLRKAA